MENLIYGFETDISNYDLKDIFLWILLMSILNVIVGKYIEKREISHMYFKLIRMKSFSNWWHELCSKVLMLSFMLTALLFVPVVSYQYMYRAEGIERTVLVKAFLIFLIGFFTMNMIQVLLISMTNEGKLSVLIISIIEVISLYFGHISERIAPWLPGSFMMYKRSNFFIETGYKVEVVFIIQLVCYIILFYGGYKIIVRRM